MDRIFEGKLTILIKTFTFESGLYYLAKSLGDKLLAEGHTVIYIPKSRYINRGNMFARTYQEPENPEDFSRDIIKKFLPHRTIDSQILSMVVKYNADYIISFETLMEKSQWITVVKRKTGVKVIDVPMIEWVTPRFLDGGSYRIFDEVWTLTDVCHDKFSKYYDHAKRTSWDFVDRDLFHPVERDSEEITFYHAGSLNENHSSKNTGNVLKAFDLFIKRDSPKARLSLTGIINDRDSRKIIERHTNIHALDGVSSRGDIAKLYQNTDCILAPSSREGLGLSFFESLACGCKLITTDAKPMNSHKTPYLCDVSSTKNDGSLIPKAIVEAEGIYRQIKKVYEDIQNGRR
jgi:glycosyltransferase involved in cell wall biosynthesis